MAVLPACRELEIAFVAYSPLGRGLLTGAINRETMFAENDFRRLSPRFQGDNLELNLKLVDALSSLAGKKGCTPSQVAIAWLLHQGENIIPIPGTRRIKYLEENIAAAELALSSDDLAAINAALPPSIAAGERYPHAGMAALNA